MDREVKQFVQKIKKHFRPEKIILFGSRARSDWLKSSDYDFVIVSRQFEKMDFLRRPVEVLLKTKAYFAADLLCYTPEEFEKKRNQIGIVSQAVKEGRIV